MIANRIQSGVAPDKEVKQFEKQIKELLVKEGRGSRLKQVNPIKKEGFSWEAVIKPKHASGFIFIPFNKIEDFKKKYGI